MLPSSEIPNDPGCEPGRPADSFKSQAITLCHYYYATMACNPKPWPGGPINNRSTQSSSLGEPNVDTDCMTCPESSTMTRTEPPPSSKRPRIRPSPTMSSTRAHKERIIVTFCVTVSTRKQSGDLERQIQYLQAQHPDIPVHRDLASGLNFHRPGLQRILEAALAGRLRTVYVTHRDRLCRFASALVLCTGPPLYDLIEFVLERCGARIVVDSPMETSPAANDGDLAEDVLSIITVFGARLYGRRGHGGGRKHKEIHDPPPKAIKTGH